MDIVEGDFPRRLVLLRHAKSDYPDEVADHDRPLAARGRRDAPLVGRWLARSGYRPDAVICSTARRARETWDLVAKLSGGKEVPACNLWGSARVKASTGGNTLMWSGEKR